MDQNWFARIRGSGGVHYNIHTLFMQFSSTVNISYETIYSCNKFKRKLQNDQCIEQILRRLVWTVRLSVYLGAALAQIAKEYIDVSFLGFHIGPYHELSACFIHWHDLSNSIIPAKWERSMYHESYDKIESF